MKRHMKSLTALLILASILSLLIPASAESDPNALRITQYSIQLEPNLFNFYVTLTNNGSQAIDEYGFAIAFFDKNGSLVYQYAPTQQGLAGEAASVSFAPGTVSPGDETQYNGYATGHDDAVTARVALMYYHLEGGSYILIPESQWVWLWPGEAATANTLDSSNYTSPDDSLYAEISGVNYGYGYYYLNDFNAEYYGKNQGGLWLSFVEDGSLLSRAGLQYGDLILFADGVKVTDNFFALAYSMAAVLAGEKVDLVYERDGVINVTRVSAD